MALSSNTVECGVPTLAETKLSEDTWRPKRRHTIPTYMYMHYSTSIYRRTDARLYIHQLLCNYSWIASRAYIVPGLDVGSSLAQQSHHLGVTSTSGCDQGGEPSLLKTKDNRSYYPQQLCYHENPERNPVACKWKHGGIIIVCGEG